MDVIYRVERSVSSPRLGGLSNPVDANLSTVFVDADVSKYSVHRIDRQLRLTAAAFDAGVRSVIASRNGLRVEADRPNCP